jgi:putative peptidoglycan lipid II flippase
MGYIRDERVAALLGASLSGDAFYLAYRIPNILRRLVAEGSMSAAFVPVFTGYLKEKEREEVWDFANRMFWTLSVLLAAVAVGGVIFSPLIVKAFTLNDTRIPIDLAVALNRIMFPYIFFIGMSALAMAILNSFRIFGVPAFTPVLLNLSVVIMSFFAGRFTQPGFALAIGILIGGTLQLAIQLPLLWKQGMHFTFGISFSHPGIRRVGKLMLPGIMGIGVAQINFFVDQVFLTRKFLPAGSLTSIGLADRVMELVLGGYAIAVGTAILPMMSQHAAEKNIPELKRTLAFSLRIVSFITIPAMVGLIVMRRPIVQVLFEHGKFDAVSTELTAWALLFYTVGLPFFATSKILVPAFYSTQDMRTPVKIAFGVMFINIVLNFMLLKLLLNGGPALSTSLAGVLNSLLLYRLFVDRHGDIGAHAIGGALLRIILASTGMGVFTWAMLHVVSFTTPHGLMYRVGLLAGILTAATGVYFGLAWLMHCEELSDIYGIARRKTVSPNTPLG